MTTWQLQSSEYIHGIPSLHMRCSLKAGILTILFRSDGGKMKRREFISLVGGAAFAWPSAVIAQVSPGRPLIAVLGAGSAGTLVSDF